MVVLDANSRVHRDVVTNAFLNPDGQGIAISQRANVIANVGATRTLLVTESGSVCLFDRAAGVVYTLPAPTAGAYFDFIATVSVTSNAYTVISDAGTTFVGGAVINVKTDGTLLGCIGNGTSHVKLQSNGTTTGGLLGQVFRATAVDATHWEFSGNVLGSGTIATPFA